MLFDVWIVTAALSRRPSPHPPDPDLTLRTDILQIEENVLATYATTDFDWAWDTHVVHGDRDGAANFMVIPLTRAAAYTVKYEVQSRNPAYVSAALDQFELAESLYPYWGHGWLSPSVVNFLTLSMYRLKQDAGRDPLFAGRIDADWQTALEILKEEADGVLGQVVPFPPLDSSTTGDTKAEEDAWACSPLSSAAVFLPDDPHAAQWEATAKSLAYAAITRPSDPPLTPDAVKTTTVSEDFSLSNHGHPQDAYYTAATIELLQQGALPYRVAGREVPKEFSHNTDGLFRKYQTYLSDRDGRPTWNVDCDEGDPTDVPLVMGDQSEYRYARLKAKSGTLWRPAEPSSTIADHELWAAIQNHKVAYRYFVNVFLWHWPTPRLSYATALVAQP